MAVRSVFKRTQSYIAYVIALFVGVAVTMIIPSNPHNGYIILAIGAIVCLSLLFWSYISYRKEQGKKLTKKTIVTVFTVSGVVILLLITRLNFSANANQPTVNINPSGNNNIIIGINQGQLNVQQGQQQPVLSLSQSQVTKLSDGTYESKAKVTSDIPYIFPHLTFYAKASSILSFSATSNTGVTFGSLEGTTTDGEAFASSANANLPYTLKVITKNQERIVITYDTLNPLGGN